MASLADNLLAIDAAECSSLGILAGWLFFGETLTPVKIVGAVLVTAGALVLAFA